MANHEIKRMGRVGTLIAAGALILEGCSGGTGATATPGTTKAPDGQPSSPIPTLGTPTFGTEATPNLAIAPEVIKIASPAEAANKFGGIASDWEINEYGGAHFKDQAKAITLNTNGAVVEGWIKSNMVGARDALTIVADPTVTKVEINGGTFWLFDKPRAGFEQVLQQVLAKEAVQQPDVTVVPLCADLTPINTTDVAVKKIPSATEAAQLFGDPNDPYSSNPNNWEINEYGGAHLKDNPNGEAALVHLNGATLEGWIKAQRQNGRPAITFVVHANVLTMRIDGGTFWNFTNQDGGFQQLLGQVQAKEAVEQPDVNVLPAHLCSVTQ
ncbi:MAG: hypothetical protein ABSD69_02500 [Candidatus Levyibacteriota bacterium]|jgi:hypothetical protein